MTTQLVIFSITIVVPTNAFKHLKFVNFLIVVGKFMILVPSKSKYLKMTKFWVIVHCKSETNNSEI